MWSTAQDARSNRRRVHCAPPRAGTMAGPLMQMPNGQMIVRSPARRPSARSARATDPPRCHLYFRKRDLTDASPPARPPLNLPQQPQIVLLREGTDTSQGKGQLISNINACMAVVDSIRTTLVRRAPLPRPRSRCASVERPPRPFCISSALTASPPPSRPRSARRVLAVSISSSTTIRASPPSPTTAPPS